MCCTLNDRDDCQITMHCSVLVYSPVCVCLFIRATDVNMRAAQCSLRTMRRSSVTTGDSIRDDLVRGREGCG